MKIIFLDIDGVLYTEKAFKLDKDNQSDHINFDAFCMQNLKDIIESTGAQIVVSSTRRTHKLENGYLWREFMRNMELFNISDKVIDIIPVDNMGFRTPKWRHIEFWIENNRFRGIKKIVIVDDDGDMGEFGSSTFVRCKSFLGITEIEKAKIINILNGGTGKLIICLYIFMVLIRIYI